MTKKSIAFLSIFFVVAVLIAGGVLWYSGKVERGIEMNQKQTEEEQRKQEEQNQNFVTDVDLDVSHWQTKETEYFTIKFPKEWYWKVLDANENAQIITNNPDFDIEKHPDIGIFSGIGSNVPLDIFNNTEIVITDRGTATSDAGTPQDEIDSIFYMAKDNNPSAECKILNDKKLPFIAYCSATYENSQMQQSYYIINKKISLTLTARMTQENIIRKEILDTMAESIILKK